MNMIIMPPVYVITRTAVSHSDPVCIFVETAVARDVTIRVTLIVVGDGNTSINVAVTAAIIGIFCISSLRGWFTRPA